MIRIPASDRLCADVRPGLSGVVGPHSSACRMVVTDLDGTLLPAGHAFGSPDLATLRHLGAQGILRVIATGRSLYSAEQVLAPDFPIDYLIFSSGAGIMHWPTRKLLLTHHLGHAEIRQAFSLLRAHDLDFMLHDPIPENHRFFFHAGQRPNPDFQRRCRRYRPFATALPPTLPELRAACQFVAIDPHPGELSCYAAIRRQLPNLKVIRSTSPLDGVSTWIEIFPAGVSKGLASAWIARRHGLSSAAALAVGNDYNDLDLLDWAGLGCVVGNAPPDLQRRYRTVSSENAPGFTAAVTLWLNDSVHAAC